MMPATMGPDQSIITKWDALPAPSTASLISDYSRSPTPVLHLSLPAIPCSSTFPGWRTKPPTTARFGRWTMPTCFPLLAPWSREATIDELPPAQVSNLNVDVVIMSLNLSVENSSGALTPESNALDGDPATAWISPGVKPHREEWLTVDLGSVVTVAQVRLQSNNQSPLHFPKSFKIQVGNNPNGPFTDALIVTNFVATLSTWYTFNVTPTSGRYVRIRATEVNEYTNGKFYASFAEVEVAEQGGPAIEATLTWTAPADDGSVGGPATSYEIRMATSVINAGNFGGANLVATGLVPQAPGSPEAFVITSGIVSGQTNWFAIETKDDAGLSSLSVISAAVP